MALIAIALVLSAVFLPMIFFGGSSGVIYRQFSATIVSAMALSVFIALTLSPALAANVLRRSHGTVDESWLGRKRARLAHAIERARMKFNDGFQRLIHWYVDTSREVVDRKWLFLGIYAAACVAARSCCSSGFLPASFRPRTRARSWCNFACRAGATLGRTRQVQPRSRIIS